MNKLRKNIFEGMGRVPYFDTIGKHIECIDQVVKIFKLKIEELGSANLDKRIEEDVRKSLNKSIEDLKSKLLDL